MFFDVKKKSFWNVSFVRKTSQDRKRRGVAFFSQKRIQKNKNSQGGGQTFPPYRRKNFCPVPNAKLFPRTGVPKAKFSPPQNEGFPSGRAKKKKKVKKTNPTQNLFIKMVFFQKKTLSKSYGGDMTLCYLSLHSLVLIKFESTIIIGLDTV